MPDSVLTVPPRTQYSIDSRHVTLTLSSFAARRHRTSNQFHIQIAEIYIRKIMHENSHLGINFRFIIWGRNGCVVPFKMTRQSRRTHTDRERESVSRIIDLDRDLLILIVHWLAICSYHRRHSHSTKCKTIGMSCFNKQFKLSARLSTTPEINWITHTHTHTRLCGESYVQQTICFHWIGILNMR